MGNSFGAKRMAKVMKITGETIKLKTPVKAGEVVKDYPGHVLLESEAVKHYGIRAKPLEPYQDLVPKRLYFLVELPKAPAEKVPRRVRSGINMGAKDRLESLMLARRSTSDLSIMKPTTVNGVMHEASSGDGEGMMRVRMKLPKAEVERLMQESKDEAEAAAKIVDLCMGKTGKNSIGSRGEIIAGNDGEEKGVFLHRQHTHWKNGHGGVGEGNNAARDQKRVSFLPISEGEMQIAVPSY